MNWLIRQSHIRPGATALRVGASDITWAELRTRTERIAAALSVAGMHNRARIAALASNGPDYVALVHAAMWTGTTLVPLNTRLTDHRLSHQLEQCGAGLLVVDHSAANRSLELGHVRFVQIEELTFSRSIEPAAVRLDDPATLMFTSGSTGTPKLVRLTWRNHEASALSSALNLGLHHDDNWLCCLPLYHAGGLSIVMRSAIYGTQMTLLDGFEPAEVIEALRSDVTIVSLVPTMLRQLAAHAGGVDALARLVMRGKLRAILLGGGPADPEFVRECRLAGLPVLQTYGMTETASQVATMPLDADESKVGAAGVPIWGASVEIRTNTGEPRRDSAGVIWIHGPMVSAGYQDAPLENRESFVGGWFRTGDFGEIDSDGYLWVHGRRDQVIVTGGENVSPEVVEQTIRRFPGVSEVVVCGLPDEEWGQRVAAVIEAGPTLDIDELQTYCRNELAAFELPREWRIVERLPRTASGKLQRREIPGLFG